LSSDLRSFSHEKIQWFNYYYSKTKGFYFRIIIKQFKNVSRKISQIDKTTFNNNLIKC